MRCPDRDEMAHRHGRTVRALQHALRWVERLRQRLHKRALSARWRRRVAVAVGLGALLVSETTDHVAPPVAVVPAPPAPILADVVPDRNTALHMGSRPIQPQPGQQKARRDAPHCDPSYAVVVAGHCWLSLEEKPPHCKVGTQAHDGRCLAPVAEKRREDSSIRR